VSAPEKLATWLLNHKHGDPKLKFVYMYHPRSDAHSVALCRLVAEDLLERCGLLREHARRDRIAYGINVSHHWPNCKHKTIDLAFGVPTELATEPSEVPSIRRATKFADVLISCEAKTVMTEHKKSQPRVFDELSSSHEIVHQGKQEAIAAGITVVNIADTFVSPLRQRKRRELHVTKHRQPEVTESMVKHLRGLPVRETIGSVGFDAYCTIVINCDNQKEATVWSDPPAPPAKRR
jgi:hypothetical protein